MKNCVVITTMLIVALKKLILATEPTCEGSMTNIIGKGSNLAGPIYTNAATGYTASRSSVLKLNFTYTRTKGMAELKELVNSGNEILTFAASELPLTADQQKDFPELVMIPIVAV